MQCVCVLEEGEGEREAYRYFCMQDHVDIQYVYLYTDIFMYFFFVNLVV